MKEQFMAQDLTERPMQDKKAVEITELFYDLVYVYAISQISHTILHAKDGDIPLLTFVKFLVMTLVFYIVWSYQTNYTNRFGVLRVKDLLFLLFNMFVAIFLALNLTKDFQTTFDAINICIAILFLSTSLQFFLSLLDKITPEDQHASIIFGMTMLISGLLSTWAIFASNHWMYILFGLAIVIASLLPMPFKTKLTKASVNVPHMLERYSLLTIIMFGETIIGLTKIYKMGAFNWQDIVLFLIIISLFGSYWLKADRLFYAERYASGMTLTIAHFFILIGLGMVNASLILDANDKVTHLFKVEMMFAALAFYYAGILLNLYYTHEDFVHEKPMIIFTACALIAGFVTSYLIKDMPHILPAATLVVTGSIYFFYLYIYKKKAPDEDESL